MSRNWIFYLEDILESAQKIRRYSDGLTFEQFSVTGHGFRRGRSKSGDYRRGG